MATRLVRAIFAPLLKKEIKACSNNRTISLIVHARKAILKIIMKRIKKKYKEEINEEQAGFVKDKGTRHQIVNIRNIMEKCKNHSIPIYLGFIDYAKVFDCVSHSQLWNIMTKMGFPMHIIDLIKKLYGNQETTVRTNCGDTEWFKIGRGVRQGCIMSPNLYNIYAEDIMREALQNYDGSMKIGDVRYSNL